MAEDLAALAKLLVDCAAAAQAQRDGHPPTLTVVRQYREDARAVSAAVLQALVPGRKAGGEVLLETPDLGRLKLGELIAAVEQVEVP